MPSTLSWLDYSERDRQDAMRVIDLFRETGTIDELGLVGIQQSFSDLFFPGTSTIQTRACYFMLVPWTFLRLERLKVTSSQAAQKARYAELILSEQLCKGDDTRGLFGKLAGDVLKRLPSEVYWSGLGSWGIRMFPGHIRAYFRSLDGFHRRCAKFPGAPLDSGDRSAPPANWHPHVPAPPAGFPRKNVSVTLRSQDAEYLRERIQSRHPSSLLAVLAGRAVVEDLEEDWPWKLVDLPEAGCDLRQQLHDAENFAVCMHGATLLYNLMLSELRKNGEWTEKYRGRLAEWAAEVRALASVLGSWKLNGVWRIARSEGRTVGYRTQAFVERWVECLKRDDPNAIVAEGSTARTFVRDREIQLKGARARFTNPRRLELWSGESGTLRMSYRWGSAKGILKDIFEGLTRSEGNARDA